MREFVPQIAERLLEDNSTYLVQSTLRTQAAPRAAEYARARLCPLRIGSCCSRPCAVGRVFFDPTLRKRSTQPRWEGTWNTRRGPLSLFGYCVSSGLHSQLIYVRMQP